MGKTDIEDALKRLDRLTQEEAQMASAQLLQITNAIDSEVRGIADNVLVVDDRVAGVDERVAGVDERVASVDERVAGVDERVAGVDGRVAGIDYRVAGIGDQLQGVDDKVTAAIDGAQYIFYVLSWTCLIHNASRWKRGQGSYPSDRTFVVTEPHFCWTYGLNHPHRESITTGSSWMALATRSIDKSHYRMQIPSQGNGNLVFRRNDVYGMEVNRFRVPTLDSWETCAPVPFCHLTPPNNAFICSRLRQEHTLVRRAFTVFVNNNLVACLTPVRRLLKM
jgi:hypothetical protein